jgi:hypothetical protein
MAGQSVPSAPSFSVVAMRPMASVMRSSSGSEALQKGIAEYGMATQGLTRRGVAAGGGWGMPEQLTAKTDRRHEPPHVWPGVFQQLASHPSPS